MPLTGHPGASHFWGWYALALVALWLRSLETVFADTLFLAGKYETLYCPKTDVYLPPQGVLARLRIFSGQKGEGDDPFYPAASSPATFLCHSLAYSKHFSLRLATDQGFSLQLKFFASVHINVIEGG
jgi:hypothetical protein